MPIKFDSAPIFSTFFITIGFMSLLYWNSLLNVIDYFNASIEPGFFNVLTFAFCFGQVLSFLLSPAFFSRFNSKQVLNICAILCSFLYLGFIYFAEGTNWLNAKKWLTGFASFFLGFFMASFQGTGFGIATSISNKELVCVNFGTGLSGVLTNILAVSLALLIPEDVTKPILETLRNRVFVYAIVMMIFLGLYFLVQHLFLRRYPDFFIPRNDETGAPLNDNVPNETTSGPIQDKDIINTALWPLLGLLFMYIVTISFVAYLAIKTCIKFDHGNFFIIPFFMFFFNLFDTIGKFLPPSTLIKKELVVHIASFVRLFAWGFTFYLLRAREISESLTNPWIRAALCAFMGLTNGYLTNCYMAISADKFYRSEEKGRAGYYSVLFLILGVVGGTILNILLDRI